MRRFLIALFLLAPCLAQAQLESTSDLQRGLVGWWRFNEMTSTNAFDLSGNNNTGTLSGSTLPVWTNGVFGGALSFDGSSGYVSVPDNSSLNPSGDFTLSAWIKTSSTNAMTINQGRIINKMNLAITIGYDLFIVQGAKTLSFSVGDSGLDTLNSSNNVADAKWHHVVGERSGVNMFIYVDGVLVANKFTTHTGSVSVARPLAIGDYSADSYFTLFPGLIDDVRIYNRALSATEVLNLYCQGGGRTP